VPRTSTIIVGFCARTTVSTDKSAFIATSSNSGILAKTK
jgi:hypothetical protein